MDLTTGCYAAKLSIAKFIQVCKYPTGSLIFATMTTEQLKDIRDRVLVLRRFL
jgi:ABC-type Na+ transport system ATPase subunit NatA